MVKVTMTYRTTSLLAVLKHDSGERYRAMMALLFLFVGPSDFSLRGVFVFCSLVFVCLFS